MTRSQRRDVVRVALFSAIGAPLLGDTLLHVIGFIGLGSPSLLPAPDRWDRAAAFVLSLAYGLVSAGPPALGLGALGGWLVVRSRDRGASRMSLYFLGAGFGLLFGALVFPILTALILSAASLVARGPLVEDGLNQRMFSPMNPYVTAGGITGLIMGIVSC